MDYSSGENFHPYINQACALWSQFLSGFVGSNYRQIILSDTRKITLSLNHESSLAQARDLWQSSLRVLGETDFQPIVK